MVLNNMKDKLIKLKNGLEYVVVDELNYDGRNYAYAVQVDEISETITKNFIFVEILSDINNKITLKDIEDKFMFEKITSLFFNKLSN